MRFPALRLARDAAATGGIAPAILNAANEVAVHAFIDGNLSFVGIADAIGETMQKHTCIEDPKLSDILAADRWAREKAEELIAECGLISSRLSQ